MTAAVAVSCGEPAGIGPELAAAAWRSLGRELPFLWIGDPAHLPPGTPVAAVDAPAETAEAGRHGLPVLALPFPAPARPGHPDPANAAAVIEAIGRAHGLVAAGQAAAMTTLPISKAVLARGAGFAFPGHTEYLAHLAGTVHIPLAEVPGALTASGLEAVLRITQAALLRDFALARPRLAVAGLNPHAGEGGLMGDEEARIITPVLDALRGEGMEIAGPLPGDTMFHPAARARYDAAVAMYHDQALIPVKTLDFSGAVNVTLGLDVIRTSPDHGTAFDIAGTGRADPASFIAALRLARRMALSRARAAPA